jgi:hypothetical protein
MIRLIRRKWPRGLLAPGISPPRHHGSRGRRRRHLERRKGQIEAQIASINARDQLARRKRETRANVVLGAVIRSHAAQHPAFVPMLFDILTVAMRRRADRELLASVLGLPALVGGADAGIPLQPETGASSPNVTRPEPPQRSAFGSMAAEVTVRRPATSSA